MAHFRASDSVLTIYNKQRTETRERNEKRNFFLYIGRNTNIIIFSKTFKKSVDRCFLFCYCIDKGTQSPYKHYKVLTTKCERNGDNMKKVLDTRTNTIYNVTENENGTFTLEKVKGTGDNKKTLKSAKLFENGTLTEYKETETAKRGRASLVKTEKASKENNDNKVDDFIETCKSALSPFVKGNVTIGDDEKSSPYYFKWENKKRKLVLTYIDDKTKQWKNVTELFYKVRFNSIHCFLRDDETAKGLVFNKALATENKGRGFNFYIEYHMENTTDAINNFIKTVVTNYNNVVKGEN